MIIKDNIDEFYSYLTDAGNLKGYAVKLFLPESINELNETVNFCFLNNLNITMSGAGTGTTGGRVALDGVIISSEKLNKIISFDEKKLLIEVESGVTLNQIYDFLADKNCFYAPNPTESNSTIGGNIANNSSGARSFKYGPTRNYIQKLEIILSNGDVLNLDRNQKANDNIYEIIGNSGRSYKFQIPNFEYPKTKNSTGYFLNDGMDLIDLFIGNEGTLGIISKVTLKLTEKPENILGFLAFFENYESSLEFVNYLRNQKTNQNEKLCRLIEFFDFHSLALINKKMQSIPKLAQAAIWFEIESNHENSDAIIEDIFTKIQEFTNLADDTILAQSQNEHRLLTDFRHALPLEVNDIVSKSGFRKIGTDTAVPEKYFKEFFEFMNSTFINSGIEYVIFGHIGDCHLHGNLFPKNQTQFEIALEIYKEIIKKTIEFKGSVSAEHGIGKIKKQYFEMMIGADNINKMKEIKKIFDEKNILGIGNLF